MLRKLFTCHPTFFLLLFLPPHQPRRQRTSRHALTSCFSGASKRVLSGFLLCSFLPRGTPRISLPFSFPSRFLLSARDSFCFSLSCAPCLRRCSCGVCVSAFAQLELTSRRACTHISVQHHSRVHLLISRRRTKLHFADTLTHAHAIAEQQRREAEGKVIGEGISRLPSAPPAHIRRGKRQVKVHRRAYTYTPTHTSTDKARAFCTLFCCFLVCAQHTITHTETNIHKHAPALFLCSVIILVPCSLSRTLSSALSPPPSRQSLWCRRRCSSPLLLPPLLSFPSLGFRHSSSAV